MSNLTPTEMHQEKIAAALAKTAKVLATTSKVLFGACVMVVGLYVLTLKGCGLGPAGKKEVVEETPPPPPVVIADPPQCEGGDGQPSRTVVCPDGVEGQIVEICNAENQWQEVSNTCDVKPAGTLSLDSVETLVVAFLTEKLVNVVDRQNARFINFAPARNLDLPLDAEYKAFNKAMNSVSFEQKLQACQPIDEAGTVCYIDLDALGISRAKFDLISSASDLKFESKTTKGSVIAQLTGARVAVLHYDDFIATVFGKTKVYNRLMGFVDAKQTLALFGIDEAKKIADVDYAAIGTNESGITSGRNSRLIHVYEGSVAGRDTFVQKSFDNPAQAGAEFDLLQSPFLDTLRALRIFKFTASESILSLPNGLHAYILNNNKDELAEFAPTDIVNCNNANCLDATINVPADCMNCHGQVGFIIKADVIRNNVLTSGNFNANEVELAKAIYIPNDEHEALFKRHNAPYVAAIEELGSEVGGENVFINVFNRHLRLQSVEQVAAYLMISVDDLKACVTSSSVLRDQIGVLLTDGKVTHDTFSQAFVTLLNECKINVDPLVRL